MIKVAEQFSPTPSGRYSTDGPDSGEEFRNRFLIPNLDRSEEVVVILDGAYGYPSSFLDEAFAGLVRLGIYDSKELHSRLRIETSEPPLRRYISAIWNYVDSAIYGELKTAS